jgi:uncharacterized membrane protein YfcA
MASKLWLNLLLWGLGDRLEKKNDYKTDILMVLNIMTWYSLLIFATEFGGFVYWLVSIINLPASWLGTQVGVGYIMVKKAERQVGKQGTTTEKMPVVSVGGPTESEEP